MTAAMPELLIADSFHVREVAGRAEVRGFDLHSARFRRSALAAAAELGAPALEMTAFDATLSEFLASIPSRIAAAGTGFPRLELWLDDAHDSQAPRLELAVRPLPELGNELEMRTAIGFEPLRHPERKGPGIAAYTALRTELGAEPLLIDEHGLAVEGGTTSLLWWNGDDARVSASADRVDSVTERLVRDLLEQVGVRVSAGSATPEELATTEVWALNALHGIRRVASIDGASLPAPLGVRLALIKAGLEARFAPLI